MALLGQKIAVSIPDTVLEEKDSLRDRTAKLGQIARACAIYGVDVIEVFQDPRGSRDGEFIAKILQYLETPQYLRKKLYPIDENLRYAGVLPPLRIPSHKQRASLERIAPGEVREGVTEADGTVDIGLEIRPKLTVKTQAGKRITVKVKSLQPMTAETVSRDYAGSYWGYSVESRSLREVFSDQRFGVKVATSRLGDPLAGKVEVFRSSIRGRTGIKLIFGSPFRGLFDIVGKELRSVSDFVLNLFPDQHVETVRTEEAIFAGLELVNVLIADKA